MKEQIFSYSSYRAFIKSYFENNKDLSFREASRQCGISSPNFFQQVLSQRRRLTAKMAQRAAPVFGLEGLAADYFVVLARLEDDPRANREKLYEELRSIVQRASDRAIRDAGIHRHWLYSVVFELATAKDFELTVENTHARLSHVASREEIEDAISFLTSTGRLVKTDRPHVYKQEDVYYEALNDVRRIDLQRSHSRYLEMAKHRLHDDLAAREYQGMTICLPMERFPEVKQRIRTFMEGLRNEIIGFQPGENVIRIQVAAFKITKDPADK